MEQKYKELENLKIKDHYLYNVMNSYFNYTTDFDFLELAASILNVINLSKWNKAGTDYILELLDTYLIYEIDQWNIIMHYNTPAELTAETYNNMFISFAADIDCILEQYSKEIMKDY